MAATDIYLLLQKDNESVRSTKEWGIVVTSIPPLVATEAKDAENNNWLDEHGIDAYNAPVAFMKEFEVEIGLGCRGASSDCSKAYTDMLKYMTTGGTEMKIYTTWLGMGKAGVYFVKSSSPEIAPDRLANGTVEFVWNWDVTLRVTRPNSGITYEVSNGEPEKLTEYDELAGI